jgi:TolA-binding protein
LVKWRRYTEGGASHKVCGKESDHDLAANAFYWIGETHYSEKSYDQAILAFEKVIKNYPGKEKAPAAMLKQAMAFKALGDGKSAYVSVSS